MQCAGSRIIKTYLLAAVIHVDGARKVNVGAREHSPGITAVGKWCVHYTIAELKRHISMCKVKET